MTYNAHSLSRDTLPSNWSKYLFSFLILTEASLIVNILTPSFYLYGSISGNIVNFVKGLKMIVKFIKKKSKE